MKTRQNWAVGKQVKVGFLTLKVVAKVATPGDFAPDAFVLTGSTAFYKSVPYNGVHKISAAEAADLIAEGKRVAAQQAAAMLAKASASAAHLKAAAKLMVAA